MKKYKLSKLSKFFILLFFLIGSVNFHATNKTQKVNQFDEIKKINDLYQQYRYFHRVIYVPNNEVKNIENWIDYYQKEKSKYTNDDNETIYINFILVYLFRANYDLDKAIDLGLSTYYLDLNLPEKNKLSCELLRMVEWCYHKKDNNLELLRINKEKLKVCDKRVVDYYSAYYNMGLFDLALKSYKEHINYQKSSYKNYSLYDQAFHSNDIGVYYMYDNKIDSAFYFYKKSILLFKQQDSNDVKYKKADTEFMLSIVRGNIGTCLLKAKKYEKAIPLILDEINGSNIYFKGMNWLGSEKPYSRIATCYIKTNQFKKATVFINKTKNFKELYYKLKSEYYNQIKNKDSTLYFKNKYIATSDSIFKQKLMQKDIESLNALGFNERIKQQEKQINILEEQDTSKSLKIKIYFITSFIVILLFLLLLYFYYDIKKKQKTVEIQKNKIETALRNNKTLLKELNHRVKNNLQMVSSVISLQASKIKDDKSKEHFYTAINRVKVLSKIHNSLYSKNELNEIDLLNYVSTLKDYLIKSMINPEIKVDFVINIQENLFINNDKKTTIGLIINELVTNSFKYAFKNKENNLIIIAIEKENNSYRFSYTDNGQGFEYDKIDKSKSIGLNLILRLVNQLGEEAKINSKKGMEINFQF